MLNAGSFPEHLDQIALVKNPVNLAQNKAVETMRTSPLTLDNLDPCEHHRPVPSDVALALLPSRHAECDPLRLVRQRDHQQPDASHAGDQEHRKFSADHPAFDVSAVQRRITRVEYANRYQRY